MDSTHFSPVENGQVISRFDLPVLSFDQFKSDLVHLTQKCACGIASLFVLQENPEQDYLLIAVLRQPESSCLLTASTHLSGNSYASLTPVCFQAHWFEREIAEQFSLLPKGHPRLKPIRFERVSRNKNQCPDLWDRKEPADFEPRLFHEYKVEGESIHEVAVGPVHAGVIEPGHFRFQCHGETVYHLETSLGYQHRGIERHLTGGPDLRTIHYMETLAGDSSIAHTLAYAEAVEALGKIPVNQKAQRIRGICLELERIASHVGDLGALAGDVAFLPTASFCGRIRGEYLNMTAGICGNRFGRNQILPGGVRYDISPEQVSKLLPWLDRVYGETCNALDLMFNTPSVLDRFEGTGTVKNEQCHQIGMVGVAAKACGMRRDVRKDMPTGIYRAGFPHICSEIQGDVLARAKVRYQEIKDSVQFVREQLTVISSEQQETASRGIKSLPQLAENAFVVSLTEAWRGEVCHCIMTGPDGKFICYKVVDPSFHNWFGLELALRGEQIADFPICNKSFNLSYCGHDL